MENSVRYSSGSGFCRFFRAGLDEEDIMTSKEIRIGLSSGLEARPAAMLVQVASQYESSIYVESEEKRVNAKSIMGMMTLGLVKITAMEAMDAIAAVPVLLNPTTAVVPVP